MNKIETRKPLSDREKKILQEKLVDQYNVDILSDSPLKLFGHIVNFAAAHTHWVKCNPMAQIAYKMLHQYMCTHEVIITPEGISTLKETVKSRCKVFKNKEWFLTAKEGFLVSYKA